MGPRVNQTKMEIAMEALARKRSGGTSLADLGYATAGLDDAWQACGTGVDGSFHDANGAPLVNTTTFPDMGAQPCPCPQCLVDSSDGSPSAACDP